MLMFFLATNPIIKSANLSKNRRGFYLCIRLTFFLAWNMANKRGNDDVDDKKKLDFFLHSSLLLIHSECQQIHFWRVHSFYVCVSANVSLQYYQSVSSSFSTGFNSFKFYSLLKHIRFIFQQSTQYKKTGCDVQYCAYSALHT